MHLKIAKTFETENPHDANDGGRVGTETFGHRTHAEQHKTARLLQHGAKNFLPFGGELAEAFMEVDRLRRRWFTFHRL
jgi:hypothetical protein